MGREDIRDLGIYLHATEAVAIEQYWFDVDGEVFPEGLSKPLAGIVWSDGIDYTTWFSNRLEHIHGINFLPVSGGSLYLGRRPGSMAANWDLLTTLNGGPPDTWSGVLWSALATEDPALALQQLEANPSEPVEEGDSRARTEHWIRTLAETGPVEPEIWADSPTATVFSDGQTRTYAAWNPGQVPQTVRFSDGFGMLVAPGANTVARRGVCRVDFAPPFGELGDPDFLAFVNAFSAGLPPRGSRRERRVRPRGPGRLRGRIHPGLRPLRRDGPRALVRLPLARFRCATGGPRPRLPLTRVSGNTQAR
jgi:hypothetical protein